MIHLFIIADDFTGALDTAVQFASFGAPTKVMVGTNLKSLEEDMQTQVLVVDAETRHLTPKQAYAVIYSLVQWAAANKIACIYKKTDSALRGNIGAELAAALDASGQKRLHFVPAFPQIDRVTLEGVHYIGNVPVAHSIFGKDPFDPVVHSKVEDIVSAQTDTPCTLVSPDTVLKEQCGILIHEAQTNKDMALIADMLAEQGETALLAGCAGFASVLPKLFDLACQHTAPPPLCEFLLAACGSINPISLEQCAQAEIDGAPRFSLVPEQKLSATWVRGRQAAALTDNVFAACKQNPVVVLDTGEPTEIDEASKTDDRERIVDNLGFLLKQLMDKGLDSTILIMGGDCLFGLMKQLGIAAITPLCEVAPGIVLSKFTYMQRQWNLLSKSGGFGEKDLFYKLQSILARWKKEFP